MARRKGEGAQLFPVGSDSEAALQHRAKQLQMEKAKLAVWTFQAKFWCLL